MWMTSPGAGRPQPGRNCRCARGLHWPPTSAAPLTAGLPSVSPLPSWCWRADATVPTITGRPPAVEDAGRRHERRRRLGGCLLYTSDAADDLLCVDLGGRRII